MQKFELKVTQKNGDEKTVMVYLDDTTAELLKQADDPKLLDTYLKEEYKTSRRARREAFWNHSLEDCMHGTRVCDHTYPAIIDKATFAAVQKRLEKNKILAGANSAVEPYILTEKAFCGYCGDSMTAGGGMSHTGQKHYYYICHNKRKDCCLSDFRQQ